MSSSIEVDDFSGGIWRMKVKLEGVESGRVEASSEDILPFLRASSTDSPLLVRVNRSYLPVYRSNGIPYKVLAVPSEVQEKISIELPAEKYIMIPKQQNRLKQILMEEEDFEWRIP